VLLTQLEDALRERAGFAVSRPDGLQIGEQLDGFVVLAGLRRLDQRDDPPPRRFLLPRQRLKTLLAGRRCRAFTTSALLRPPLLGKLLPFPPTCVRGVQQLGHRAVSGRRRTGCRFAAEAAHQLQAQMGVVALQDPQDQRVLVSHRKAFDPAGRICGRVMVGSKLCAGRGPLNKGNNLIDAVELRQELYRRLCCAIWGRAALGFPEPPDAADKPNGSPLPVTVSASATRSVARQRRPGRPTDVELMVRAGVLSPGTRVVGSSGATEFWATVDEEGSFVLQSGDRFRKADDAGSAVLDKRCRGMKFWHIDNPDGPRISLADLRRTMLAR